MADRAHRMLYRDIPKTSPCKAGCQKCCGPVPWSEAELSAVQSDIPAMVEWLVMPNGTRALMDQRTGLCPFLTRGGCGVYDRRPFMCRVYGASAEPILTCPEGVVAARPLSVRKTCELTNAYSVLQVGKPFP